jgi:UDP-glucuronate 4-epimerase
MKHVLVTGCAGFIGMHVAKKLLQMGHSVIGVDNLNNYYNTDIKKDRLNQLKQNHHFVFSETNLIDSKSIQENLKAFEIEYVIHLAAQPGVRYSIDHPEACIENNIVAFVNVLEFCRQRQTKHLVYASSSSVYGMNTQTPYATQQNVDHPVSLYAASKKSNELMAHCYSHLFNLPTTGLRFFTVYGPWGRPDMSPWLFSKAILNGQAIRLFNHGDMSRDFTYIDDIVEGTVSAMGCVAQPSAAFEASLPVSDISSAPYRIYNIGNQNPVRLLDFVHTLENALGRKAILNMQPMQPGDVLNTSANIDSLYNATGYQPKTDLADGLSQWAQWFIHTGQHYAT